MAAYEQWLDDLVDYGAKETGTGKLRATCPAHNGFSTTSLAVTRIEGSILVHCFGGCSVDEVLDALGKTRSDLYDDPRGATYRYSDNRVVVRTPDKQFRQQNAKGATALFHVERLTDADVAVFVVEGEKDVLAVEAAGGKAVCSAQGASNAHHADWTPLTGKCVFLVPDADEAGATYEHDVTRQLIGIAASINVLTPAEGKDVADHVAAGKTLRELIPRSPATPAAPPVIDDKPKLWSATDLTPGAQPRWLANGRLLRAAINLLIGDEGIGKSLLWVWVTAAVTTGKPLPEFGIPARDPGRVIVVVTEDDWSTTVRPRLEVAGADLSKISVVCIDQDGSGAPTFPDDLHLIAEADPSPVLVVVDAWLDTVPAKLSVKDPQQARQALHPWRELATATDAAVLLLTHTNRVSSANARDRYGATGELRKKARLTLFAQADEDGRLIVGTEKANTAGAAPASTFKIVAVRHFEPTEEHDGTVGLLAYVGDSDRTAREHLADSVDGGDEPGGNPAAAFVYDHLLSQGGELAAADVLKAGRTAGFSEQELKDARRRHRKPRIESRKASFGNGWVWAIDSAEGGTPREGGTKTPEGGEGGTQGGTPPVPPTVPPSEELPPSQTVPGALRPDSPGQTERVKQTLASVAANIPTTSSFGADPQCFHCDKPVVNRATGANGRFAHFECEHAATDGCETE